MKKHVIIGLILIMLLHIETCASEPRRVIIVETMPVQAVLENSRWFQVQLQKLGYEQGNMMALTVLQANGDRDRAERLLSEELERGMPDLVVTVATMASQTAVKVLRGTGVPILFFSVSDPVGAGLVDQLNVPTGTHITGKVYTVSREAKLEMILRLISPMSLEKPVRFGFIHSTYPSSLGDLKELTALTRQRDDVTLVPYAIAYRDVPAGLPAMLDDTRRAIETLRRRVDFWIEPSGPLGETTEYTRLLLDNSTVPIAFGTKLESVRMGALLHITPNPELSGREAALLADQILQGADPGQIPVTPPSHFDIGLNVSTALRLNIVIPPEMLELAGGHIYK